ncbi:MAG: RDD family protein [Anaerolineae bacterium]|nr:RDD family protein [Anaerolineae bacterium]
MGQELAGIGQRFIALVIDGIILGVIGAIVGAVIPGTTIQGANGVSTTGPIVSFIIGLFYYWYFLTQRNGQTPGKKIMNVRVVREDGAPLTFVHVLVRYIGYTINSLVFMLGWIWAFFDSKKQGWHDKLAGTIVIKT